MAAPAPISLESSHKHPKKWKKQKKSIISDTPQRSAAGLRPRQLTASRSYKWLARLTSWRGSHQRCPISLQSASSPPAVGLTDTPALRHNGARSAAGGRGQLTLPLSHQHAQRAGNLFRSRSIAGCFILWKIFWNFFTRP